MSLFDEEYQQQVDLGKSTLYARDYSYSKTQGNGNWFATNYAVACTLIRLQDKSEYYMHVYASAYAQARSDCQSEGCAHVNAKYTADKVIFKPTAITFIDSQMEYYSKFKALIIHCKNKGTQTWDYLKPHEQAEAAYYLLRSDLGSEIVADSEDLNLALAEGIFYESQWRPGDTPIFKNAKNHITDVLDKQFRHYANKVFDEPEEV